MAAFAVDMNKTLLTTGHVSVIVLKLQEFTRRPVADQTRLKAQIEALVALAIQLLPAADRIVLDAPDGVAVVVLGTPKDALDLAERAQAAAADLPVCIGVNHGPIKPAADALRGFGLVGDGLAAGMTLANVATPGRILVSRPFHEALQAYAPGRAVDLSSAGAFTDLSVRTYELFTLDRQAAPARRRRLIALGTLSVIGILGLGFAARGLRHAIIPTEPAVLEFKITPRGDVFIDGVLKGKTPPLQRLEIRPGRHSIEVRNSPYPPLTLEVNLASAEEMRITHSFTAPRSADERKSVREHFRDLRRQLGF